MYTTANRDERLVGEHTGGRPAEHEIVHHKPRLSTKALEDLEIEYRRRVAEIRMAPGLSWEKREKTIRELGLRYDRERRKLQSGGKA
jgi:hypothetical protein